MAQPPYLRIDDDGTKKFMALIKGDLNGIIARMRDLASKNELHELDEALDDLEASLGTLAFRDNASGLYTPEGSVSIETTKDVVTKNTYTLDGENLIIGEIPVEVITGANGAFTGSEGNISVS
jgi:predicted MPP superfamily phosphohydrolase